MIIVLTLVLLSVVVVLLAAPRSTVSQILHGMTEAHPRIAAAALGILLAMLTLYGFRTAPQRREADVEGYAELWHMVQTDPVVREIARSAMADGTLTAEELQHIRQTYRNARDLDDMRKGVAQELSR